MCKFRAFIVSSMLACLNHSDISFACFCGFIQLCQKFNLFHAFGIDNFFAFCLPMGFDLNFLHDNSLAKVQAARFKRKILFAMLVYHNFCFFKLN